MKKSLFKKVLEYLPIAKQRFFNAIDLFLIYQIILVLFTPSFKHIIILGVFAFIFYIRYYKS